MVNPLDFIPKLSGFSPMPLGIMAPFMGYQSAALAYNFGLNYEFGKRVIKSMSNEKFNKIADDPILLNELTSRHHDVLLKAFINEVPKVDKIQDLIIKKMVELEFAKIKVMPELIAQIPKGFIEGIFSLGGGQTPDEGPRPDVGTPKRPPREPVKPILPKAPVTPRPRRPPQKQRIGNLNDFSLSKLRSVNVDLANKIRFQQKSIVQYQFNIAKWNRVPNKTSLQARNIGRTHVLINNANLTIKKLMEQFNKNKFILDSY